MPRGTVDGMPEDDAPAHRLPTGTRVVTCTERPASDARPAVPAGTPGTVIVSAARGRVRVRLVDGREATFDRAEIEALSAYQRHGTDGAGAVDEDVFGEWIIYRCVIGSRAYGLTTDASDVDRRGIYLAPAEEHWSLYGVPEQLNLAEKEACYWELEKFIRLALKANPNILECLFTPIVETVRPEAEPLLAARDIFLSKLAYQTYNGYVLSRFKKLEGDLRNRGAIRWKHAMHLVRLLLSGIALMRTGAVQVEVSDARDELLAVRRGERTWEDIDRWRIALHREFEAAYLATKLPERPDYGRANALLVEARRTMAERSRA